MENSLQREREREKERERERERERKRQTETHTIKTDKRRYIPRKSNTDRQKYCKDK